MRFKPAIFALMAASVFLLPTALTAEEPLGFPALDPALVKALERAVTAEQLKTLGYDSFKSAAAQARVAVETADCRKGCGEAVARGMCLCGPDPTGACPKGATPGKAGGSPQCSALPATVDIFASEGGLGTTRLTIPLAGPGG